MQSPKDTKNQTEFSVNFTKKINRLHIFVPQCKSTIFMYWLKSILLGDRSSTQTAIIDLVIIFPYKIVDVLLIIKFLSKKNYIKKERKKLLNI